MNLNIRFSFLVILFYTICIFCGGLVTTAVAQELPGVGNDNIFQCDIVSGGFGCTTQLVQVYNPIRNISTNSRAFTFKKARKTVRKYLNKINRRIQAAKQRSDIRRVLDLKQVRRDILATRRDFSACRDYVVPQCDAVMSEALTACDVAENPAISSPRNSDLQLRIVNGERCSDVSPSPVVKISRLGWQWCTGVLIDSKTVLTAAHCLPKNCESDLVVSLQNGDTHTISSCIGHPDWGSGAIEKNDIALLRLDSEVQGVQIAKIYEANDFQVGESIVTAGFGINEISGDESFKATFNVLSKVTPHSLETIYRQGDVDRGTTCSGDSGGPLFIFRDASWYLVGTVSNGTAPMCALPDTAVSTDIARWSNLTDPSNISFIANNT